MNLCLAAACAPRVSLAGQATEAARGTRKRPADREQLLEGGAQSALRRRSHSPSSASASASSTASPPSATRASSIVSACAPSAAAACAAAAAGGGGTAGDAAGRARVRAKKRQRAGVIAVGVKSKPAAATQEEEIVDLTAIKQGTGRLEQLIKDGAHLVGSHTIKKHKNRGAMVVPTEDQLPAGINEKNVIYTVYAAHGYLTKVSPHHPVRLLQSLILSKRIMPAFAGVVHDDEASFTQLYPEALINVSVQDSLRFVPMHILVEALTRAKDSLDLSSLDFRFFLGALCKWHKEQRAKVVVAKAARSRALQLDRELVRVSGLSNSAPAGSRAHAGSGIGFGFVPDRAPPGRTRTPLPPPPASGIELELRELVMQDKATAQQTELLEMLRAERLAFGLSL